ncbi:chloride channel protein [Ketobacter sp. MCCC 1A13808]|uniref:chloride channel protein n=1 Tax=Ketobacter sp. MCCC 1A13808 TaxID=2602738 RepID=UPI000F1C8F23|nr:chloride channel protein [Ketobacter sp. MCCC 1A13808]MVF12964.1 chloride channel protein [Ketobacter sp. MCCC 1A13808]RLP53813.1 MAG: chloride channel protein [Ketobacter sp.]
MKLDFDRIREKLSTVDALPLLSLLGILAGLSSGLIILLFRFVIEFILTLFLPGSSENFEALNPLLHSALPLAGAATLGTGFHFLAKEQRRTGIGYVIERFNLHQGAISLRSLLVQFGGAAVALISGLSMGREGPAVHLGAAGGSLLGQWSRLPNNSVRVLTGCGCAAAISASFNTPIAGVIFAMEVIMMEYSISTFIPIILASVVGASLTRAAYGHAPAFSIPEVQLGSLIELPFIVVCGLVIGCLAAALIYLSRECFHKTRRLGVGVRFLLAGAITGFAGFLAPQILGIGYDTVNAALVGGLGIWALLLIMSLKIVATGACVGMGLPGGIIGPSLFIGAMAGAIFGSLSAAMLPDNANITLYVLLGMAGMMAATLEAPLAALMTLLELTFEANIIFPGMLVVVISSLVASQLFKQKSIFQTLLKAQGITVRISPLATHLHRIGVAAVMDRSVRRIKPLISREEADELLKKQPNWLLIEKDGLPSHFLPAADLALHLGNLDEQSKEKPSENGNIEQINLLDIPAHRDNVSPILLSATLQEALETMKRHDVNAVYVRRMSAPNIYRVFGLVRKQDIEHFYQV